MSRNSDCSAYDFTMNYDLKTKIGEGTFSDVWLCVKRDNGNEMAAKILKKDYRSSEVNAATLNAISEVKIARTVGNHPFLLMMVGVYFDIEYGKVVLVSELMQKSLYDAIENATSSMSRFRIKIYTYQMLEGLKYLHQNDVIHRDIKPENILLRPRDKQLKIGDFGTSCHVSELGQPHRVQYVATRWYRSPECMLTRGRYGKGMDVWSVGCVMYEMVMGHAMFSGEDEVDQMHRIGRVLGRPDPRLIGRFERNASVVFATLYGTEADYNCNNNNNNNNNSSSKQERVDYGLGLHTVYPPHMPAYDLLKDMLVYDPDTRFSAERLLRKSYFNEVRSTPYYRQVKKFEKSREHKNNYCSGASAARGLPDRRNTTWSQVNQIQPSINDQQRSDGNRSLYLPAGMVQGKKVDNRIHAKTDNVTVDNQNKSNLSPLEQQSTIGSTTEKTASTIKIRRNLLNHPPFK